MRVIETSCDEDLAPFSRYLWEQRILHRIFEERGRQILEVAEAAHALPVRNAHAAWLRGELRLPALEQRQPANDDGGSRLATLASWMRGYPVLCLLVLISLAAYPFSAPISEGRLTDVANWLTLIDFRTPDPADPQWSSVFAPSEPWRLLTPVFLHFSMVHLLFNCAVTLEFGRRVEAVRGSLVLLIIFIVAGVLSNLGQFWWSSNPLFGGLSGVAYSLLGFVLVSERRRPAEALWRLPKGMAMGLLVFLVIFSSGITEAFGLYIANAAHWTGLLTGCALALLWPGDRQNQQGQSQEQP
ncbi:MAG: rhomboid family intramembrane serine protease [Pseudomonadales bacterium]|nr:rhomboid family intramembrane serine protease [Pseudomonadales bacterium]